VPAQPTKDTVALYLELPAGLRRRLDAFVRRTRRTLKGEVANAIEQYLDREEARQGPPPDAGQAGANGPAPKPGRGRKKGGGA
jgi:predicted transcriptional regulator